MIEKKFTPIKKRYGFMPTSVWQGMGGCYSKFPSIPRVEVDLTKRSKNCKVLPGLPFSRFNPIVAQRIIKYWSSPGDTILDPFMGYGTRGFVAEALGRDYIGYEISPSIFKAVEEIINQQQMKRMRILESDGCKLERIKNEDIDLIFTCPPFWTREKYESVEGQLSDCPTYVNFLSRIGECARRCHEVLKPEKFCIFVVADFRKKRKFRLFHWDTIKIFSEASFRPWDIVVNVLNSPFVRRQIGKCEKQRYTAKTHEYILVFKKVS